MAKIGGDPLIALTIVSVFSGTLGALFIPFLGLPQVEVLPWLALSVIGHTAYRVFLARAYVEGDLGQVYPLARGAAPLLVALLGTIVIDEPLRPETLAGIVVLSSGIAVMTLRGGRIAAGLGLKSSGYALLTAALIAGYTLVDGLGGRIAASPLTYSAWLFLLNGIAIVVITSAVRGRRLGTTLARYWKPGIVAGAMSSGSYAIAIWAMTQAPIAVVAALRETSILFAALISVAILREPTSPWRAVGGALILCGLAVMRLA